MVDTLDTPNSGKGRQMKQRPHVIDQKLVGQHMALEVVQAFYSYTSKHASTFEVTDVTEITRRLHEDIFHVGLRPSTILRALNIRLELDDLVWNGFDTNMLDKHLQSLLGVERPQGFQLKLTISCDSILDLRLSELGSLVDILRPILLGCKGKGMEVTCVWASDANWYDKEAFQQLFNRLVDEPNPEWQEEASEILDPIP